MMKKLIYWFALIVAGITPLLGQGMDNQMRIAVQEDRVYIYHTQQLRIGYGFNI